MKPLVSVIVTTYNRPELLKETLVSILAQTFKDFELIVVDNNSKYDFFELINSLNDNRIQGFQNANNGIIAVNRNFGIRKAQGPYIAFCDDDDLWLPRKLEKQLAVFEQDKSLWAVGTNAFVIPKGSGNFLMMQSNKVISFEKLATSPFSSKGVTGIIYSSVLCKKECLTAVGFFDENPQMVAIEDYDFWLRILSLKDHSIFVLNENLVKYRQHLNNTLRYDPHRPTTYDRLALVFAKYNQFLINQLRNQIPHYNQIYKLKMAYYEGTLSLADLMKQNISLKDKVLIVLKKILKNYI
jgi:teichuronic acid biosynthesis glycosyltransferase TuaG